MSEEQSKNPVRVTSEERSRPVYRLLARAAILLAKQLGKRPASDKPADSTTELEEGNHA